MFSKKEPEIIPQEFFTDIDIYKKDGVTLDKNKIKNIDIAKIDFAYDNGIGYMQEIENGMKIINARATLLLSYLSTLVIIMAGFLFRGFSSDSMPEYYFLIALIGSFFVIIIIITFVILNPSFAYTANNQPENILTKEMFQHDIKAMKIFETERLQNRIKNNNALQLKKAIWLANCMIAAFAIPILVLLAFLFVSPLY